MAFTPLFVGCDKPAPAPPPPTPQSAAASQTGTAASPTTAAASHGGVSLAGTVKFDGTPPEMKEFPNSSCGPGHKPVVDESVLVSKTGGGLANCLVYLEGAPAAKNGSSMSPAVLDQIGCQFVPHVVGVVVDQPLTVRSTDETLHNVHYIPMQNKPANFAMVGAGQEREVTFDEPEIFKVTCDVHPWMSAWIGVFPNAYFAVTGEDGSYKIDGVPPGEYKLVVWHERLGRQEQAVKVAEGEGAEKSFTFKPATSVTDNR